MPALTIPSPVGALTITEEGSYLTRLSWRQTPARDDTPLLREARSQLAGFFTGTLKIFDLPLAPSGSEFHRRVWESLSKIQFGQTLTYAELATKLDTAPRAIGGACARNPIPILIPCHRIIGTNAAEGGYSGGDGLETKAYLLEFEREHAQK